MPESTEGLLAQILQEQIATRRDIADLRVDLATHGETSRNLLALGQDHETRLRALEAADNVTRADMAAGGSRFREWGQLVVAVSAAVLAVVALLVKGTP